MKYTDKPQSNRPVDDLLGTLKMMGINLHETRYGNDPERLNLQTALLTKAEVAQKIRKSVRSVDRLIEAGKLNTVQFGESVLIPMCSFIKYYSHLMRQPYEQIDLRFITK